MAEEHHVATLDPRHAGDHAVTGHSRRVPSEEIDLFERVAVDQARDSLAGGQLPLRVLALERLGVAVAGLVLALAQLVERVYLSRPLAHRSMNIQRCPSMSSAR